MTEKALSVQRKLKIAAFLLIVGLLIEGVTLYRAQPTSFLVFICISGTLVGLGILIYLLTIITA
jgi:hypothetical protein